MFDVEGVLGPEVTWFVQRHVRSLLTWDVLVFFERNPDAVMDVQGLASRLGRRVEEIQPEVEPLCEEQILACTGGLIRYQPTQEMSRHVSEFVMSCQDKGRRLALIALVLRNIGPPENQLQS